MLIGNNWEKIFKDYFESKVYASLIERIKADYDTKKCCPPKQHIFRAYKLTDFLEVKVVILGQDPYYSKDFADGLAFSTANGGLPMSLKNVFDEVKNSYPDAVFETTSLRHWAKQGVLLLNTCLSVVEGKPLSHVSLGWEELVQITIQALIKRGGVVFMLWGSNASKLIPKDMEDARNRFIRLPHPSPLSAYRGFLGSDCFLKCNNYLKELESEDFKAIDFSTYKPSIK